LRAARCAAQHAFCTARCAAQHAFCTARCAAQHAFCTARCAVRVASICLGLASWTAAVAQTQVVPPVAVELDPVVVTATRTAERSFDVPASVSTIDADVIRDGQPMVNLSETLLRVPGIVANNRQNYSQDLQISSRGFGARAQFGVRGIRLYQDDIPQTMPDGQGQTGSFMLLATRRIEVLRGPFSTLYGNASGGVISVFTESGRDPPSLLSTLGFGSYGSFNANVVGQGVAGGVGYVVGASHFETDGYRDHSAASRDLGVGKLTFSPAPGTRVTILATTQSQPNSQDPLGLTRAQWEADPRQSDPVSTAFDTRKSIGQQQIGVSVEHDIGDATQLKAVVYGGQRDIRQYLSFSGVALTSSGGTVDLQRGFGGASLRLTHRFSPTLSLITGAEYESQDEHRRGYVNNNGDLGDLRRNEDDKVASTAVYAQMKWDFAPDLSLTAGVRGNAVRFDSADHYITPDNPDDSGNRDYRKTVPVAGITWHARDNVNVYASYGQGFETPTFAEIAYRAAGPGINFDLKPATSTAYEVGVKTEFAKDQRLDVALFSTDTADEIVIDAATGGRTTYKNGGKTRRRGVEVEYGGDLGHGVRAHLALTWLDAKFVDAITTGSPPVVLDAGNKLPGVPAYTAYGELAWTPTALPWLETAVEVQSSAKIYVNERNSDAAPAYTIANVRVGVQKRIAGVRWGAFARLNNITDRNYVGSVIVGDTNGRYFEPAPGRNWFAGVSANVGF
jgi:iron complex outermembrane recepter protein